MQYSYIHRVVLLMVAYIYMQCYVLSVYDHLLLCDIIIIYESWRFWDLVEVIGYYNLVCRFMIWFDEGCIWCVIELIYFVKLWWIGKCDKEEYKYIDYESDSRSKMGLEIRRINLDVIWLWFIMVIG